MTQVVTAPASEPVSVDDLMDLANIDVKDQPALLTGYITAARIMVDKDCERALMPQTLRLYMDAFPGYEVFLERPPVQSITSIVYYDTDGTSQTWSASNYDSDLVSEPCRINPAYGKVWPFTRYKSNAVAVTYVAGYADAASVPETAKLAIKMLAAHWYQNRETTAAGQIPQEMALAYSSLVASLKWRDYA